MTAARDSRRYVVVTRDEGEDGALTRELTRLGLASERWPVIRIGEPEDPAPLERALERLAEFDWIVFASAHAVAAVTARRPGVARKRLPTGRGPRVGGDSRTGRRRPRVAAVGPATAKALREAGWAVAVVAPDATAASLVRALTTRIVPGSEVLLPRSSRALPTLARGLVALGARLCDVEAYVNEPAGLDVAACRRAIRARRVGAVTFASPSAVEGLATALGTRSFGALLRTVPAIAIGPTTASALTSRRVEPTLAQPHTLRGLASAARSALLEASRP